jgi:hypothetical protein
MKISLKIRKLVSGLILFELFQFVINSRAWDLDNVTKFLEKNVLFFLYPGLAEFIANLASAAFGLYVIYYGIGGLYRICTFNLINPAFDKSWIYTFDLHKVDFTIVVKGNSRFPNINRILDFRESELEKPTPLWYLEPLLKSKNLEPLYTGFNIGKETEGTLIHMECRIDCWENEAALKYIVHSLY